MKDDTYPSRDFTSATLEALAAVAGEIEHYVLRENLRKELEKNDNVVATRPGLPGIFARIRAAAASYQRDLELSDEEILKGLKALAETGLLAIRIEENPPPGQPARYYVQMTPAGKDRLAAFRLATQTTGAYVAGSAPVTPRV